jgi:hypothetical protein
MNDPVETVWEMCWFAERLGARITTTVSGSIRFNDGCYDCPAPVALHPLEAALLGCEHGSGDWMRDVATFLAVEVAWVEGFIDGFARATDRLAGPEYEDGYLAGGSLRTHRYPRLTE